jgi:hypothetical protein
MQVNRAKDAVAWLMRSVLPIALTVMWSNSSAINI